MGLVITRRINEKFMMICGCGNTTEVQLGTAIRNNQVSLCIEAPEDVKIFREEIYQRILRDKEYQSLSKIKC